MFPIGLLDAVNILHSFVTFTSLNVTWSAPYTLDGVDILGYNITITNTSNGNILHTHFTQDTQYVISNNDGDPCTELTLTISGYNGAGDGDTTSFNFTFSESTYMYSISLILTKPNLYIDPRIQSVDYESSTNTLQATIDVSTRECIYYCNLLCR